MSDTVLTKVSHLNRPKSSIRDLIDQQQAGRVPVAEPPETPIAAPADHVPPPKKSDPLPKPGEAYRACAQHLSRLGTDQRMLHFVRRNFDVESFSYADLRRIRWIAADDPGSGPEMVMVFVEAEITEVRVSGRHLDDIHYWISEGLMPWVWEHPQGFHTKDQQATVITGIKFTQREK
jgi:hypothetical protein